LLVQKAIALNEYHYSQGKIKKNFYKHTTTKSSFAKEKIHALHKSL